MVTAVCTGGEAPPASAAIAWLDICASVVAADGGLRILKSLGRKADLWVGDGDSLGEGEWEPWYREAVRLDSDKDDSDTDAAVAQALNRGADEVWLLGGSGGRMDHWWSNLRLLAARPQITRWLTAREQAWSLVPEIPLHLSAGPLSVFPLGAGPWKARSHGLKWSLDTVDFSHWHSLSNVAAEGASIEALSGRFLVLRPLEDNR